MAKSYLIMISEEQRIALQNLIKPLNITSANDPNKDNPLLYWDQMLEELPEIEKENPRITHGFCL